MGKQKEKIKNILILMLFATTFMWFPSKEGNPPILYAVDVCDRLGQIIETATVSTNRYTTDKEGTIYISVSAIDANGNLGEFSEWSNPIITTKEEFYIREHARLVKIPFLSFLNTYAISLSTVWSDPHENNK